MARTNRVAILFTVCALAASASFSQPERVAAAAAGEGKLAAAQKVTVKAKVEAIDLANREVTLKQEDGTTETVVVSEEVKNLPQLKVGDTVTMEYFESLTLALDKTEGAAAAVSEKAAEQRAEAGQLPGGVRAQQITVVAKVTAIDAKESTATLTGPKGRSVVLEVAPETLAKVKVGDHVNAVYTEALAVKVTRETP
jgi:hypothetical protein